MFTLILLIIEVIVIICIAIAIIIEGYYYEEKDRYLVGLLMIVFAIETALWIPFNIGD